MDDLALLETDVQLVLMLIAVILFAPAAPAIVIDWIAIEDAGNSADPEVMSCCGTNVGLTGFGAVSYDFRISRHEITNTEYAEFLNAVAVDDLNDLYSLNMGDGFLGGIARTGLPGSYAYNAMAPLEVFPVNNVSLWDALRFANWLHNGQPSGPQDDTTTEDGAYTLSAVGILNNTIVRNPDATVFLTSEDEWYKAAYYDPTAMSYFDFPAGSDTQIVCDFPGLVANTANCDQVTFSLTEVGAYTNSTSPYGTFDQGGNVFEWLEEISSGFRVVRGRDFFTDPIFLGAATRDVISPAFEEFRLGFRVAALPEPPIVPSVSMLVPTAIGLLAGLLAIVGVRHIRA